MARKSPAVGAFGVLTGILYLTPDAVGFSQRSHSRRIEGQS